MRRRKSKKTDVFRKTARSAAKAFGSALVTTALVFGVAGCRDAREEETKDRLELQHQEERADAFQKHLEEKLGCIVETYDIKYPEGFDEMLRFPFDKSDGITYNFLFNNVDPKEVPDIIRALGEALDAYYAERKFPTIKDDKDFEEWYVSELNTLSYKRENGKGSLDIGVQFEKIEEEVMQKKKKARKNGK